MSEPLTPELEARAQELATRITARSAGAVLEMARRLVATTDDTLLGDTEFALRAQAHGVVADADADAEYLPQKVGTPPPLSTAPTADAVPPSTATARRRSRRPAGRSPATGPTTTAGSAARGRAPGTPASG